MQFSWLGIRFYTIGKCDADKIFVNRCCACVIVRDYLEMVPPASGVDWLVCIRVASKFVASLDTTQQGADARASRVFFPN